MSDTQKHTKPNVPNLRFPGFSDDWEKKRIGDIGKFFSGGTPSSSRKDFYGGEIPFIRSGEIHSDSTELFLTQDGYNNSSAKMVEIGDILLALYGANSGDISISQMCGAINQAILCIRTSVAPVFFKSVWEKHTQKILNTYLQGGQGNLSADIVKKITISIPSRPEQTKIAAFFSLLDERITVQNKVIEDLKRLKRAINNQFHDSVTCGIKTCLADLGNSYSGLSGKAASDFGEGYPFIPYTNVFSNTVIDENDYGLVNVSKDEHQNIVEHGDLIITLSSETPEEVGVGAVYMGHDKEIYLNSFCFGIHFHALDRVMPKYLAYMVESNMFRRFVYPLAQGSTRYNLQKGDFEKKLFTLPTLAEQSQIVAVLDTISSKLDLEKSILKNLTTVKASMIQGLFV